MLLINFTPAPPLPFGHLEVKLLRIPQSGGESPLSHVESILRICYAKGRPERSERSGIVLSLSKG